jgi:cysteine desulfurase
MDPIYLDNNATTRIDPRVAQAMHQCDLAGYVNPASPHGPGRTARRRLETARDRIAEMLGCHLSDIHADRVIFTSGGTEANNLALLGLAGSPPARLIVSSIEHPSIFGAVGQLQRRGFDVQYLPVTADGVASTDRLADLLRQPARLVSVMLANHETGVIQPLAEIAQLCQARRVLLHTDAVQAVGKIPVHFRQLGVTALSLTAHKFHGPRGIGALLLRPDVPIQPILHGGFQQQGLRPGTESVSLAVGLETALALFHQEGEARCQRLARLRDRFESCLRHEIPQTILNGLAAPRVPHASNLSFPGLDRQAVVMALDLAGVACSTGSACASGSSEPSPVLRAMGLADSLVEGAVRFAVGSDTSPEDVEQAASRMCRIINDLYRQK